MDDGSGDFAWRSSAPGGAERTVWERDDASFPVDMFHSWIHCMTRPGEFFASLDPGVAFSRPFLFFLVFWILGSGLGTLSVQTTLGSIMADYYAAQGQAAPGMAWNLFMFFLSPFIGVLALLINTAFIHAGVRLFTEHPRRIGASARSLCYVAAPQVLTLVPFLGWIVAPIWGLVLTVIAVQKTHDTTVGRSLAAVLIPPLVFWFVLGVMLVFLVVLVTLAVEGAA